MTAEAPTGPADADSCPRSAVEEEVARERAGQGLPPKITDPRALARVAQLVADDP
jgi:hypothetical protein